MATLASKGDLVCGAATLVEGTAALRWVRVQVYNRDSVEHAFVLQLDGTPIKRRVIQPEKDYTFPLMAVQGDIEVIIEVVGAKVSAEPTWAVSGTH